MGGGGCPDHPRRPERGAGGQGGGLLLLGAMDWQLRAEFHPALKLPPSVEVISKGMDPEEDAYSAFQARDAEDMQLPIILGTRGIQRLFVGGLTTDYCVKTTVLDAIHQGFQVVVLEDAIRAVNLSPSDGAKAIEEMRVAGAQFLKASEL